MTHRLLLVLAGCTTLALAGGCHKAEPTAPPPPKVAVAKPVVRDIVEWDEYTGRTQALESVEVRPRVTGYVQSIQFADGANVKEGDPLFVIDPRPYDAALAQATAQVAVTKARLALAKTENARAVSLVKQKVISTEDAERRQSAQDEAAGSLGAAEAAVQAAALDVEFTRVVAPVAGRASRHLVDEGNLVTANQTLLTTIVSLDPIHIYFDADERAYLKYVRLAKSGERASSRDVNNPVEVGVADETGFPHKGWMDFVDNQFDPDSGTMIGRAIVPNPDQLLSPGQFVRIRIPGSGRHSAILVPDEAIGTDLNQKLVWVIDADNKAQYRAVQIGALHDGLRIVREGVSPDERIVVAGIQKMHPGLVVAPEERSIDAPAAPIPTLPVPAKP
jgi:RND family efflux transporter MFP subunit